MVKLPDGLRRISEGMFLGSSSIVNIVLPDSIKTVDGFAFQGCSSLETIDVPDGCESIGDFCFYECHSLRRVVLGLNVDYYLYKKRVVVPADAVEVYRKDENWSRMEVTPCQ